MAGGAASELIADPANGGTRGNAPNELPATARRRYTLDATDSIVAEAGDWDRFALANDGESIPAARVIGRRLDDFISSDVTRMFVRAMLMSARTLKREVQRSYRCDSERMKRLMQMTIMPRDGNWLDVCHHQLTQEPRQQQPPIVNAASGGAATFVKRCSMCNRIRVRQKWNELDYPLQTAFPTPVVNLTVVYGVCPDCLRGVVLRLPPATAAIGDGKPVPPAGKAPG